MLRPQRTRIYLSLSLLVVTIFLGTHSLKATTIDPLIWQQMVAEAEFVGVVECIQAGGIVARYRVIESWKGPKVGTEFNVRTAINYWGPQFPVSFAGERFVMTGYKDNVPSTMMSTTSGGPVPLWWRRIEAEYRLPLWQGAAKLPLSSNDEPLGSLGSKHKDVASFKKAVEEFLSLTKPDQETALLKAIMDKYMFGPLKSPRAESLTPEQKKQGESLRNEFMSLGSAREIVLKLLTSPVDREGWHPAITILGQGGGEITLDTLEKNSERATNVMGKEGLDRLLSQLSYRLKKTPPKIVDIATKGEPSQNMLDKHRKAFALGPDSREFGEAFETLTEYDPAVVALYLTNWVNENKNWQDTDAGYPMGSYFALRCGRDREANLRKLLEAKDPFIRVAGAVYLVFENRELGIASLSELMKLPGDPGVWAALNLASRGNKEAVERAIEVLRTSGQRGHMSGVPHENLQLRLLILLSNSATASKLEQPRPTQIEPKYDASEADYNRYVESVYRYYSEWWRTNKDKITLSDPWLATLEKQKID